MDALRLTPVSPDAADIRPVLQRHFDLMRAQSPEESCHVMNADELLRDGVEMLAVYDGDQVLGIGGLKRIAPHHGELKSMHTLTEARGRGVARVILAGLYDLALTQGLTRLSLETGTDAAFLAARKLYESEGFLECAPFGDYEYDPLSVFMSRDLSAPAGGADLAT